MPFASVKDMRREARRRLPRAVFDFFAGGADDEVTLRDNARAFQRWALLPRILRPCPSRHLGVSLWKNDAPLAMPIVAAPTAFHRLAHPEGELGTARALAQADALFIVSMASTVALEDIAAAAHGAAKSGHARLWFQLYVQPDRAFTARLIRRAEAAGFEALVITVDSPVFGRRDRDWRNGFFDLPAGLSCETLREPQGDGQLGPPRPIAFSAAFSWSIVDEVRKMTSLPIVLKGILHPADALLALEHEVSAIYISNHGGRQLDGAPATLDVLPAIARVVAGRLPILVDGGVRRGTDVLKALALGANAVGVGRSLLWGLATEGPDGVARVLAMLRDELDRALAMCGCSSLDEVSPALVGPRREPLK
ncbi:alpha-hydroxy acid oxidase [Pendulispora albinea]|uniref:Alpha-hydroxy-acid oxidizing protein n=1 Tax=Pendulispora albinea TaxID=2741071 RepID=A0ABZ2M2U5_9BACT